ncbi:MAG TPA: CAP domain-containing protein [Jatrophihabitantaceae bacterium]|nr:CAP domain-containing protein [Jatrophihabitantaceae bacterium]
MLSLPARMRRALLAVLVTSACALGLVVSASPTSATSVCAGSWSATDSTAGDIACYLTLMVNQERAAHGIRALSSTGLLRTSAYRHDGMMYRYNTLSHQLPTEPNLGSRVVLAGFNPWVTIGENIAYNTDMTWRGAQYVENLMYNEVAPYNGHRLNILNTSFTYIGVTVWMDTAHHKMWITVDFGRP